MWGTGANQRPERESEEERKQGGNMHYLAAPTPLFNVLPALSVMCCGVADEWAGTPHTHTHTHTHTHSRQATHQGLLITRKLMYGERLCK